MSPRRSVKAALLAVLPAAVGVASLASGGADAHTCAEVDRHSPPSTVTGECSQHDLSTHDCTVHPVTEANLVVTTCTDAPVADVD